MTTTAFTRALLEAHIALTEAGHPAHGPAHLLASAANGGDILTARPHSISPAGLRDGEVAYRYSRPTGDFLDDLASPDYMDIAIAARADEHGHIRFEHRVLAQVGKPGLILPGSFAGVQW